MGFKFIIMDNLDQLIKQISDKYNLINLSDRIKFGKHQGKSIAWIILNDARYFQWLRTVPCITISSEIITCFEYQQWLSA